MKPVPSGQVRGTGPGRCGRQDAIKGKAKSYERLRAYCGTVPLVDCHDHTSVCGPKYTDPVFAVIHRYFRSDIHSASGDAQIAAIDDAEAPLERRWPILQKAWRRTCHTGYAQVARLVMKKFYGEQDLTLDAMQRMSARLLDLTDRERYEAILDEAGIAARLVDMWPPPAKVLDGTLELPPRSRLVIPLPGYHGVRDMHGVGICDHAALQNAAGPLGRRVTCLDEYLAACRETFEAYKRFGAVAFKDQSAYDRRIDYANPPRAEAEKVFNRLMEDPRRVAAWPDGARAMDDYLFHELLRMAGELDLPVQIHTGHMGGVRNDIVKANAVWLTSVFELHRDVRFDLIHANWPYGGELLFLCKNYPNVAIDFSWVNVIDPVYCQGLYKQALAAVPHGKVHAFGSDLGGSVDRAWAHAEITRDNVAVALSEMVDLEYLDLDEAEHVAHAWLFANPNAFFRLGL